MTYRAPINDILLALNHGAGLKAASRPAITAISTVTLTQPCWRSGKFASDVLAPLNKVGDEHGIKLADNKVTTHRAGPMRISAGLLPGERGVGTEAFGGQGLPLAINAACTEIWSASNIAFGSAAADAVRHRGARRPWQEETEEDLSGETGVGPMTGTMAAHGVAGRLRRRRAAHRAERAGDGAIASRAPRSSYLWDHDMTDNIVHFVLARLPDAPAGTKGISLFLIPKFLVNADGSLGALNDIYPSGVEHKLGMHASPTCTMTMGDKGGAIGYLVGEENRGMLCMFTMMNQARLGRRPGGRRHCRPRYQQALAYAQERRQGPRHRS